MTTLPDMIREAHKRGLKVSNLFELTDGGWRANVRRGYECQEFGNGDTAEAALENALSKVATVNDLVAMDFLA